MFDEHWPHIGPGCKKGLQFIYGKSLSKAKQIERVPFLVTQADAEIKARTGKSANCFLGADKKKAFGFQTVEHTLCEYARYMKQFQWHKNGCRGPKPACRRRTSLQYPEHQRCFVHEIWPKRS